MTDELDIGAVLEHYDIYYRADRSGEQSIRCPVHEDRIASASLNLGKGLFNCHACGSQGDALVIIMEKENVWYASALKIYEAITGTSGKLLRKGSLEQPPRKAVPPGSGYKPRVNRKLPPGSRKRTDFGA